MPDLSRRRGGRDAQQRPGKGGSDMSSVPRRVRRLAVLVLATAVAATAAVTAGDAPGGGGATARAAANVTITARDFFWSPDTVTIQVGDTVTWTNAQGFHNVLLGDSRLEPAGLPERPGVEPAAAADVQRAGQLHVLLRGAPGHGRDGQRRRAASRRRPRRPRRRRRCRRRAAERPTAPPPTVSNLSVSGANGRATVRLTVSERATVNVRFARSDDVTLVRAQVKQGTWTFERELAAGRYVLRAVGGRCHGQPLVHAPGGGERPWLASLLPSCA